MIDPRQTATAVAEELQRLQGTWIQRECEVDGVRNPDESYGFEPRLSVTGSSFVVTRADGMVVIEGTFKIDPTREPKAIDWSDTFGEDAGKTFPAIYALDGDRLVFCVANEGEPRPEEFRTRKGQVLRIHQRVIHLPNAKDV